MRIALTLGILTGFLIGCSTCKTLPDGQEGQGATNAALDDPKLPRPNKGWDGAYTTFIKQNISPEMLAFPAPSFCPKFYDLSWDQKKDFWSAILESTAYAESAFNRLDMYREDGQAINKITGKRNTSEGLLQMSYGDVGCEDLFDFSKDREAFLDDYSRLPSTPGKGETWSKHPGRTILNPYRNILCGIKVWTRLIKQHGNQPPLVSIGGKYWSTLRPERRAFSEETIPHFRSRFPACFR